VLRQEFSVNLVDASEKPSEGVSFGDPEPGIHT
jgi:hypothetical protein